VGGDDIDAMVDDRRARTVVALSQNALRHRHADRVRETLSERTGRRLDARRQEMLGMTGSRRAPLAETLDLFERKRVAREMQRGVLENARVPGRQDESISIRPDGVLRVEAHDVPV